MFVEKVYHGIKCDRCKEFHKDDCGNENFDSDIEAIDSASEHMWQFVKEIGNESFLHYCPECCEAMQEEKEDNEPIVIRYKVIVRLYDFGYVFAKGSIIELKGNSKNEPKFETKSSLSSKVTYYKSFFELYKDNFKLLPND